MLRPLGFVVFCYCSPGKLRVSWKYLARLKTETLSHPFGSVSLPIPGVSPTSLRYFPFLPLACLKCWCSSDFWPRLSFTSHSLLSGPTHFAGFSYYGLCVLGNVWHLAPWEEGRLICFYDFWYGYSLQGQCQSANSLTTGSQNLTTGSHRLVQTSSSTPLLLCKQLVSAQKGKSKYLQTCLSPNKLQKWHVCSCAHVFFHYFRVTMVVVDFSPFLFPIYDRSTVPLISFVFMTGFAGVFNCFCHRALLFCHRPKQGNVPLQRW